MLYRATKAIITEKKNTLQIIARLVSVCIFVRVSSKSLCGQPPDGYICFCHSVCRRKGGNGELCPLSPFPFFVPPPLSHPNLIFNGLHWCHRGISVAKALKGLKSAAC